jgi:hypothetical protein
MENILRLVWWHKDEFDSVRLLTARDADTLLHLVAWLSPRKKGA